MVCSRAAISWRKNRMPSSPEAMLSVEPALRTLDVALLQTLFFEELLGLTPDDLCSQRYVDYTRDADEALRAAASLPATLMLCRCCSARSIRWLRRRGCAGT